MGMSRIQVITSLGKHEEKSCFFLQGNLVNVGQTSNSIRALWCFLERLSIKDGELEEMIAYSDPASSPASCRQSERRRSNKSVPFT